MTQTDLLTPDADEASWHAVTERNQTADGTFYYAVRTTGIYCRPSCPARRPRRENVAFFETTAQAQAAGYRACRRCTPDEVNAQQLAVSQAKQLLESGDPSPSLDELGQAVGWSPAHLQRVFKRLVGLSPKQYALHLRSERLKASLKQGDDVTSAMYGSGYNSSRSLYDQATDQLGMSPGTYKKGGVGQTITYAVIETLVGPMLVAATERGLCAVWFGEPEPMIQQLRAEYPRAQCVQDAMRLRPQIGALQAYLGGQRPGTPLRVDVSGTAFQQQVWNALQTIPYGETRSYAQVAEMIGQPSAVRAVAQACAANPVALVVPCHRVVRSGGALSGYRWGVDRKRALLREEQAHHTQEQPAASARSA